MKYRKVTLDEVPKGANREILIDVYVMLPLQGRYVRFVAEGDEIEQRRILALELHPDPSLYVDEIEWAALLKLQSLQDKTQDSSQWNLEATEKQKKASILQTGSAQNDAEQTTRISQTPTESQDYSYKGQDGATDQASSRNRLEAKEDKSKLIKVGVGDEAQQKSSRHTHVHGVNEGDPIERAARVADPKNKALEEMKLLREPIRDRLLTIYNDVLNPDLLATEQILEAVEGVSRELLHVIAPDAENLLQALLTNAKYVHIMNDVSGLVTISTLYAAASGFTARGVFKDLSYACILMDMSLSEFEPEVLNTYYVSPEKLTKEQLYKIRTHPMNSYKLMSTRLKGMSEVVGQMILGHHELYSGKGYPRGVRSDLLPPIVRVLSLAVDTFERIKKASQNKESPSLWSALESLKESEIEPHMRRHSRKMVLHTLDFIEKQAEAAQKLNVGENRK